MTRPDIARLEEVLESNRCLPDEPYEVPAPVEGLERRHAAKTFSLLEDRIQKAHSDLSDAAQRVNDLYEKIRDLRADLESAKAVLDGQTGGV